MKAAVTKAKASKNYAGCILCERGTTFGPDNLVVDMRDLIRLRGAGVLVGLDATHAAQKPAARVQEGLGSDGDLQSVEIIAKAGAAIGVDVFFLEVHPDPSRAPVDAKIQWPLNDFDRFLGKLIEIALASND